MTAKNPLTPIKELLITYFTLDELHTLTFDLGLKWGELLGYTLSAKSRELVLALARNNRLSDLIKLCRELRPNVSWPDAPPLEQQLAAISEGQPTPQKPAVPMEKPPRVIHFTNREEDLAKLMKDLQPGRVITLCGPGGIGKTALAAETVWRLAPNNA
ncbi:MAG: hypothetical protein AAF614_11640, partial [Chloroflexota bacterium]